MNRVNGMSPVYRLFCVAVLVVFLGEGFFTALASVPGQIGPYRLQVFSEPAVIPVGKARISALLPSTNAVVEKDIEIKAGEALELPLELPFNAKTYAAAAASAAAAAASAPPPAAKP